MGSVKDLIKFDDSPAGRLFRQPTGNKFGVGAWKVSGRFSVGDLKEFIPLVKIKNKAEALTMTAAAFYEHLADKHPKIPTCYIGVLDKNGKVTDTGTLLQRGELTDIIVMKLAHVPETYCKIKNTKKIENTEIDLTEYRNALWHKYICGVADIEIIFRKGYPLGSSIFKKIFAAAGKGDEYELLSTYEQVSAGLRLINHFKNSDTEISVADFSKIDSILKLYCLKNLPLPGLIADKITYEYTTKFEKEGDLPLTFKNAKDRSGFEWTEWLNLNNHLLPDITQCQLNFCEERGIINMDGKYEFLDHTADAKFRAYGKSLEEAFSNAAAALTGIMFDAEKVEAKTNKSIQVEAGDLKSLLVAFLGLGIRRNQVVRPRRRLWLEAE